MNSSQLKPYFIFSRPQWMGLLTIFAIIITMQSLLFFTDFHRVTPPSADESRWLALQSEIDSLKLQKATYVSKIYPFNPNFITDFKGYKLGMSVEQIDRLLAFRKTNKYVNSASEFQAVTKVSDSLLNVISPYFKFPDWVNNKRLRNQANLYHSEHKAKITMIDINNATAENLIKVYGIGAALSSRILKQKESLGGFVSMEQMKDVWGLSPEVVDQLQKHFNVGTTPNLLKININKASVKELSQFPYFRYPISKEIVTWRSMNGNIRNSEDLAKIRNFPVEKIDIIAVYLEF